MAEVLFPKRQRCKGCGRSLGLRPQDPVLLGLYCAPRCAGMANPASRAEDAPRECTTMREGKKVFKRRYRSEDEIPHRLSEDPSMSSYSCGHCGHWHLGHTRMGTAEKFRMFEDLDEDLPDLLVSLRGKASHKQVAEVAGVRPIRIRELESGVDHPENLKTLGKVLKAAADLRTVISAVQHQRGMDSHPCYFMSITISPLPPGAG